MHDSNKVNHSTMQETIDTGGESQQSSISKRAQTAFQVALGKWLDSNGRLETVIQTGEAFGRGLYSDFFQKQTDNWTIETWLSQTINTILEPIGQHIETIHIDDEEAFSHITRCPLQQQKEEPYIATLFTYGLLRGLLRSVFPTGEVVMGSTLAEGAEKTEFIFRTNATPHDRLERERVKTHFFTVLKR